MADKDTLMEEFVATEAAKNEDAAKDLERVEQEIVAEATMSTEEKLTHFMTEVMACSVLEEEECQARWHDSQ